MKIWKLPLRQEIQVVQEEDTNLRPPVLGISGVNTDTTNTADDAAISTPETNEAVFPSPANSGEVDPFAPVAEAGNGNYYSGNE